MEYVHVNTAEEQQAIYAEESEVDQNTSCTCPCNCDDECPEDCCGC